MFVVKPRDGCDFERPRKRFRFAHKGVPDSIDHDVAGGEK